MPALRFLQFGRRAVVALAFVAVLLPGAAQAAAVLLDSVSGNLTLSDDSLNTTLAPFALVHVGTSDVQVGGIGIFGQLIPNAAAASANVRWDIFSATGARIYDSGPLTARGSATSTWFDSPGFASPLTLKANSDYYYGLITDASFLTRYYYNPDRPAYTIAGNGLSSPGGNQAGSNGVVTSFDNPVLSSTSAVVQLGSRIFPPGISPQDATPFVPQVDPPASVPLPAAAWLLASGLLAFAGGAMRVGGRAVAAGAGKIA